MLLHSVVVQAARVWSVVPCVRTEVAQGRIARRAYRTQNMRRLKFEFHAVMQIKNAAHVVFPKVKRLSDLCTSI